MTESIPEPTLGELESLRALGFAYVSLDLQGYRTGSLNKTFKK